MELDVLKLIFKSKFEMIIKNYFSKVLYISDFYLIGFKLIKATYKLKPSAKKKNITYNASNCRLVEFIILSSRNKFKKPMDQVKQQGLRRPLINRH